MPGTEEMLNEALKELEELRMEKHRGKRGWEYWHNLPNKRLGILEVDVQFISEMSEEEWNMIFGKVRILQAVPDVFKGTVEYTCMGLMFEVCEAYNIPKYTIECRLDGNEIISAVYKKR